MLEVLHLKAISAIDCHNIFSEHKTKKSIGKNPETGRVEKKLSKTRLNKDIYCPRYKLTKIEF